MCVCVGVCVCVCVCVCNLLEEGFSDLPNFSKFAHVPLTVKVVEFIQRPDFLELSVGMYTLRGQICGLNL